MKKKTLEEKIRQVGFWTTGGMFWYLVIAFFLKSNYPIYEYNLDRSTAYDVVKDALTLAAAFLAPVAAFVLFTDWREQHRLTMNERLSINILERVVKLDGLLLLGWNIQAKDSEGWEVFKDNFIKLLKEIREEKEKINLLNDDAAKLKSNLESLNYICSEYLSAHYNAVRYEQKRLSVPIDSDLEFNYRTQAIQYGSKSMELGLHAKKIISDIRILYI